MWSNNHISLISGGTGGNSPGVGLIVGLAVGLAASPAVGLIVGLAVVGLALGLAVGRNGAVTIGESFEASGDGTGIVSSDGAGIAAKSLLRFKLFITLESSFGPMVFNATTGTASMIQLFSVTFKD